MLCSKAWPRVTPPRAGSAPETLGRLRLVRRRLSQAARARDYPAFRQADFELHETMIDLAAVPLLHEAWLTVWNGLLEFHERGFEDCFPDVRVLGEEHEYLVETLALGDPGAAEDAARSHIEAVWYRRAEQYGTAADIGPGSIGKEDKSHFVGSLGRSLVLSRSPSGAQRELQAELLRDVLLPDLVSERAAASNRPAQGVQLAFRLDFVHQLRITPNAVRRAKARVLPRLREELGERDGGQDWG